MACASWLALLVNKGIQRESIVQRVYTITLPRGRSSAKIMYVNGVTLECKGRSDEIDKYKKMS